MNSAPHSTDTQEQTATAPHIASIALYSFDIPLSPALPVGKARIDHRRGLILQASTNTGEQAAVEISPLSGQDKQGQALSGFSPESLVQMNDWLRQQLPALPGLTVDALAARAETCPGASGALGLSLLAAKLSDQLPASRLPQPEVPLIYANAELDADAMAAQIRAKVSALPDTVLRVKVKVGQLPMETEIRLIHEVLAANPKLKLRLDANRAFTLEEATDFICCLPMDAIEYIEEPCRNPTDNIDFYQATGVGFALDESLNDPDYEFAPQPGLTALVIKPMLIGSVARLARLIDTANRHGVRTILSSALESSLGITDIRRLAAWLTPDESPGVDTLGAFTQGLLVPIDGKPTLSLDALTLIMECRT